MAELKGWVASSENLVATPRGSNNYSVAGCFKQSDTAWNFLVGTLKNMSSKAEAIAAAKTAVNNKAEPPTLQTGQPGICGFMYTGTHDPNPGIALFVKESSAGQCIVSN